MLKIPACWLKVGRASCVLEQASHLKCAAAGDAAAAAAAAAAKVISIKPEHFCPSDAWLWQLLSPRNLPQCAPETDGRKDVASRIESVGARRQSEIQNSADFCRRAGNWKQRVQL